MAGTWMPADTWVAAEEARRERRSPVRVRQPEPELPAERPQLLGHRGMRAVPRTTRLLDHQAATDAATLAQRIGIGRAAARLGVHRRTLRDAWNHYAIEVIPPGAGRRKRSA
jgi:hypothetical protein